MKMPPKVHVSYDEPSTRYGLDGFDPFHRWMMANDHVYATTHRECKRLGMTEVDRLRFVLHAMCQHAVGLESECQTMIAEKGPSRLPKMGKSFVAGRVSGDATLTGSYTSISSAE
jgi:hypothetical protein